MPDRPERRFWDTCCFTALIAGEAGRVENCRLLLNEAAQGGHICVTSALTLVELTRRSGVVQREQRDVIDGFFLNTYIELVPIDRLVAELAREVVWEHGLKPADAIQVATARRSRCATIYTYDEQMLRLDDVYAGIRVLAPIWTGQPPLIP